MSLLNGLRNSMRLRQPLLAVAKALLSPLNSGPPLIRRVFYDALRSPYFVTSAREHFVVSTRDKVIGKELFLDGEFDFSKLIAALAILKQEGLEAPRHLIDVGANIGSITIPALARGLFSTATAIEPHPENVRLLRTNVALNGLSDRVRIVESAVGDKAGAILLLSEAPSNSGNHAIGSTGLSVTSCLLDDLEQPSSRALLWMDIEGYEGHALAGGAKLLNAGIPFVSELNFQFLQASGGMDMFERAADGRRIFDLGSTGQSETSLEELKSYLSAPGAFTDILAIPRTSSSRT